MRELKSNKNILTISDAISGSKIEIYYRIPTASEIQAYMSRLIQRKGNKIKMNIADARLEFGLRILEGFRDGDFGIDGKPISSNPASEYYVDNWKELLKESAPDIIMLLAQTVFEGSRVAKEIEELEFEDSEEVLPLAKS